MAMYRPECYPLLLTLLAGCKSASADDSAYRVFDDARLDQGRAIWMDNCEGCHGYGVGGAPIPMKPRDWQSRLTKDIDVLYDHAINGFFGPDDTLMPERGGNPQLSDDQVRAAVDYVTALARWYIQQKEVKQ